MLTEYLQKRGFAMKKITVLAILITILTASVFLAACGNTEQTGDDAVLTPVTICLDWTPNINHAGLYIAQHEGYFTQQGLDVTIVQPGDNYALQLVAAGQAQFGISYQEEVTFGRIQGIPVVSLAAIMQHNTSCFASPKDKGIETVADFDGRTYGGWGGQVETALLDYLAEKENYQSPVEIIDIGSSDFFAATASGQVDFSWIYYGVTGIEAQLRSEELNLIWVKDIDPALDYYTPVVVAEEKWLADNEDTAKAFMAAVSKGYIFAAENPEKATEIMLTEIPELNEENTAAGLAWAATQFTADAPYWGYQNEEIWQGFADWLYQQGILSEEFAGKEAFTNDYLPQ